MLAGPSAKQFVEALEAHRSPDELEKLRRYVETVIQGHLAIEPNHSS
jgi:hypothetical protein